MGSIKYSEGTERRVVSATAIRAAGTGAGLRLTGYAALFNVTSGDLGGFREIILPGAFRRSVAGGDVRALWQHDPLFVLGRTKSGTLKLAEDSIGLRFEIFPPDTQWTRDALTSMKRGDVNQCSFGFKALKDAWRQDAAGPLRVLFDVDLFDVSPVTFPAFAETSVEVQTRAAELNASPQTHGWAAGREVLGRELAPWAIAPRARSGLTAEEFHQKLDRFVGGPQLVGEVAEAALLRQRISVLRHDLAWGWSTITNPYRAQELIKRYRELLVALGGWA